MDNEKINSKIKLSNNSSFVILIFVLTPTLKSIPGIQSALNFDSN